jgi:hypothetical protein
VPQASNKAARRLDLRTYFKRAPFPAEKHIGKGDFCQVRRFAYWKRYIIELNGSSRPLKFGPGGDLANFRVFDDAAAEVLAGGLQHGAAEIQTMYVEAKERFEEAA